MVANPREARGTVHSVPKKPLGEDLLAAHIATVEILSGGFSTRRNAESIAERLVSRTIWRTENGWRTFMSMRLPGVLVACFVAGLMGGVVSHFFTHEKRSELRPGPIRATRIELVDEAGKTRAFLGTDNERDTALVFLDDHSQERAKFGVWANVYSPKLVMRGEDGKERIRFHLTAVDDRPIIIIRGSRTLPSFAWLSPK